MANAPVIVSAAVMARMQALLNQLVDEDKFGDDAYALLVSPLVLYMEAYERVYCVHPEPVMAAQEALKAELRKYVSEDDINDGVLAEIVQQHNDDYRELTEAERATLYSGKCCFCKGKEFLGGPRGGMSQNIECEKCGARFNLLAREVWNQVPGFTGQLIRRPQRKFP